ncbi:DEAD-box helicase [Psychrobacillus phage Perkons]|nr:DEAD-box helicase [Psychrobacillus phage Perkons]
MITYNKNSKFSDVINTDTISNWKGNVILNGGTGTGKTYFILNQLVQLYPNKRFLYLVNRIKLYEQIEKDIRQLSIHNVELCTYQSIDTKIHHNKSINDTYDYIICDEFHYVVEDSTFNELTQNSYDYILNNAASKIFISATCNSIFNMFEKQNIVPSNQHYFIPKHYDYVNEFIFYRGKYELEEIISDLLINTDDKILLFINDLERGVKLYHEFIDDAIFYCSKHAKNTEAVKISNETNHMINGNTFDTRLLITTSALDNGVNLIDRDIKHVICTMTYVNQIEQCLGRKRIIDEDDTCTFYFYERNRGQFNHYDYYIRTNTDSEFSMKDIKGLMDNLQLDHMKGKKFDNGKYMIGIGFKEYIIDMLKFNRDNVIDYDVIKEERNSMELEVYLDSLVGKRLYKDEQIELKRMFEINGLNARTLGINTINGYIKDIKLNYMIVPKQSSERIDGKVKSFRFWEVINNLAY